MLKKCNFLYFCDFFSLDAFFYFHLTIPFNVNNSSNIHFFSPSYFYSLHTTHVFFANLWTLVTFFFFFLCVCAYDQHQCRTLLTYHPSFAADTGNTAFCFKHTVLLTKQYSKPF